MKKVICALFLIGSLNASAQVLAESVSDTSAEVAAESPFVFEKDDFVSQEAAEKYRKFIVRSLDRTAKVTEFALDLISTFDSLQTRCELNISLTRVQESLATERLLIKSILTSQK